MNTKLRKRMNSLLAFVLVAVMSLSTALSPLPGMLFDYEAEKVEAAVVTDTEDAVYLPITLRDAKRDGILFEGSMSVFANPGQVNTNLKNGKPDYKDNKAVLGQLGETLSWPADINMDLYNALLYRATHSNQGWFNITSYEKYKQYPSPYNGTFTSIYSSYDAARWYLDHLFSDDTYTGGVYNGETSIPDSDLFMKKIPQYENLVLQKGAEQAFGRKDYYYYTSSEEKTLYDTTNREIRNSADGEIRGWEGYSGGFHPLNEIGYKDRDQIIDMVNCCFTTEGAGQFVYHKNEDLFFGFLGDDDVYLYIDGKLVIDMGGLHNDEGAFVSLESKVTSEGNGFNTNVPRDNPGNSYTYMYSDAEDKTWAEYLGLEEGETYDFHFFHMEREDCGSNFNMFTNIRIANPTAVPEKVAFDQSGSQIAYGGYVEQNANITYGFKMTNGSESGKPITNMTFVDKDLGITLSPNKIDLNTNVHGTTLADLEYQIYNSNGKPSENGYSKLAGSTDTEREAALKSILTTGIAVGKTFIIRGFKYNVGTKAEFENILETSATGQKSNGEAVMINGTAEMLVRTTSFTNKTFVIDYAKPMTVTKTDVFGTELNGLGNVGTISLKKAEGSYGTMVKGETDETFLTYTPNKIMNGVDPFVLNVPVTTKENGVSSTANLPKGVTIVPANSIYYEDTFTSTNDPAVGIVYTGGWTTDGTSSGNTEDANGAVHGWTDSLKDDATYSDGIAHKNTAANAKATFTFKGTGVDIYSRTDMTTGTVIVSLKGQTTEGKVNKYLIVDNYAESNGEDGYYQIPTVWFNDLEYGTYTVEITVTSAAAGRSTYYLDGIRVYNPIQDQEDNKIVQDAYTEDELDAVFTGVRDILLDSQSFKNGSTEATGMVFVDEIKEGQAGATEDTTEGTDVNVGIGTYKEYGPKNEVYLKAKQSIAFKVNKTEGAYYYIGLKSPTGSGTAQVTSGNTKKTCDVSVNDQYFEVTPNEEGYIVIANVSEADELLSVTKLRTTGCDGSNDLAEVSAEEAVQQVLMFRRIPATEKPEDSIEPEEPVKPEEPEVPKTPEEIIKEQIEIMNSELEKLMQEYYKKLNQILESYRKWFG